MSQATLRFKNIARGVVDEGIEAVESGVKTQAQQTAKSFAGQFTGQSSNGTKPNEGGNGTSSDLTHEVVKDFYEPSDPEILNKFSGKSLFKAGEMTPEEEKKKKQLQMELHKQVYLDQLLERKSKEQEHQEEEQVKEEEKKMEDLELEEKKKKDDEDIALKMVTNKTEQFPGVAG